MPETRQTDIFPVLDPGQLRRIESTHRGFLYQHVYGAGCLLIAGRSDVQFVAVERDEDVELRLASAHVYVQVKTRQKPLTWSDVESRVQAFNEVRRSHAMERQPLKCELWIVSNIAAAPSLQQRMKNDSWPSDVHLLWPEGPTAPPPYLPPAWSAIDVGVAWCSDIARAMPFSGLAPETLTWKLAAIIQFAATGASPYTKHRIAVEDLPSLFELITAQLQQFPSAPSPYREIEDEPELVSGEHLRIIIGVSGSGKTSWATEAARHTELPVSYFDVAQTPSGAIAPYVARELARSFVPQADAARSIFAPGLSGLDTLRLLDQVLEQYSRDVTVIIDNSQSIAADTYRQLVGATKRIRWVLLSHPCTAMHELAALLDVQIEQIKPWTRDSLVAELAAQGCPVTAEVAERVRRVTGGLPLFVRQAATLGMRQYGGDMERLCQELENHTHTVQTSQETILQKVAASLDGTSQRVGGVLSLSEVSLTTDETLELVTKVLSIDRGEAASSIRALRQAGVIGADTTDVYIHESFRLVLKRAIDSSVAASAQAVLKDLVTASLSDSWDFHRLSFLLRLLVVTGDEATVVDISTSLEEQLLEYGMVAEVRSVLEEVVKSDSVNGESRFWAMDSLVYWSIQDRNSTDIRKQVDELATLHASLPPDKKRLTVLLIKQMLLAGLTGDAERARIDYARAEAECHDDPALLRILRYDLALALFTAKQFSEVEEITSPLISEYYEALGLEPHDVLFANPPDIAARLPDDDEHQDVLKRLADTLELYASSLRLQGRPSGLSRIHALKFYVMVSAFTSAIRVGQDVADEMLEYGAPDESLNILENQLLPLIEKFKLLRYLVPVRAQRAVVLAYLGRHEAAVAEMNRLRQFVRAESDQMAELTQQQNLVQHIVQGRVRLRTAMPTHPMVPTQPAATGNRKSRGMRKVGRNARCPCGSGKKYKKCCGRQ